MTKPNWKVWAVAVPSALVVSCCTLGTIVGKPKTTTSVATPAPTVSVTIARATDVPTWTVVPTVTLEATLEPTSTVVAEVVPTETAVAVVVVAAPTAVAQTGGAVSGSDSFPCADGQIKGNINSNKYHPPSGQSYAKTVENVICFDTEAAAEAAGFIRAKR